VLADAYRVGGAPELGLAQISEAERLAEATQVKWVLAETLRLRGDLLAQTGDRTAAEASYREALALAQQQSAKLWELRGRYRASPSCRNRQGFSDACQGQARGDALPLKSSDCKHILWGL
jgi:hypothetical protein